MITQKMALSLIDVCNKNGTAERKKSILEYVPCQSKIVTKDGKLYGSYWKNRFCILCCSIRKAELINKYLPKLIELLENRIDKELE